MAEIELPVIVTAIANSELEGFVSGTLFSQGWSVVYRALDLAGLERYLSGEALTLLNIVLVYSPDLPDITPSAIALWQGKIRNVIGFSANSDDSAIYLGIHPVPKDVTELASIVRGSVRAPLLRSGMSSPESRRRAHVIALGGASTASGCTTVALNLAMELSVLGKSTLLLDGDVHRPAIAALLGVRKLDSGDSWKVIAPNLSAGEITQERVRVLEQYMTRALSDFDYVIIDLGTVEDLGESLTDRRWAAALNHWACDHSDEIWFLGKADVLGIYRMELLVRQFSQIAMKAKVSILLNMKAPGRKGSDDEGVFLASIAPLKPQRIYTLPRDSRAPGKAERERATLIEVDDRNGLRKAIAKIAVELTQ
ncbi:MAG: adenylyl-sulfate kinase [Actinomycetes bacterium]